MRRCAKLNVQFATKDGAVEESLEAFGLKEWLSHITKVHRAKIEKLLETAGDGVLASSWKHRLALMPFAIKDLEIVTGRPDRGRRLSLHHRQPRPARAPRC